MGRGTGRRRHDGAAMRAAVGGLAAMAMCALWQAGAASAVTVVSGKDDANQALEIDPSTTPTNPQVHQIVAASNHRALMFVQRMPVTKVVSEVTIGDLARGPDCVNNNASLTIYEHLGGDPSVHNWSVTSTDRETLPPAGSPGRVTWSFNPRVLRKDRGYSFQLDTNSGSCAATAMTTWEHEAEVVDAGPTRCQRTRPMTYTLSSFRMWHEAGQADAVPCPANGTVPSGFDPGMPTGWLLVRGSASSSSVSKVTATTGASSPDCWYEGWGLARTYWRPAPGSPTRSDYVCLWNWFGGYEAAR
jgi:hypothetical protein